MSENLFSSWKTLVYGLRRVAVASGDNLCPSVGHIFPLIALINTDIPCIRANPCSSVVGIISHWMTSFRGVYFDHWTSLNNTEPRICFPRIRVNPCPSVGDNFPLIAQIYTDISCIRGNPCSSVVGIISHWMTSFRGYILTTELHWTTLNKEYLFALRSAQKSQLSKPNVSVLVGIV